MVRILLYIAVDVGLIVLLSLGAVRRWGPSGSRARAIALGVLAAAVSMVLAGMLPLNRADPSDAVLIVSGWAAIFTLVAILLLFVGPHQRFQSAKRTTRLGILGFLGAFAALVLAGLIAVNETPWIVASTGVAGAVAAVVIHRRLSKASRALGERSRAATSDQPPAVPSERPLYKILKVTPKALAATIGLAAAVWGIITTIDARREHDRELLRNVSKQCGDLTVDLMEKSEDFKRLLTPTDEERRLMALRKDASAELLGPDLTSYLADNRARPLKFLSDERRRELVSEISRYEVDLKSLRKKRADELANSFRHLFSGFLRAALELPPDLGGSVGGLSDFSLSDSNDGDAIDAIPDSRQMEKGLKEMQSGVETTCREFQKEMAERIRRTYVIPSFH